MEWSAFNTNADNNDKPRKVTAEEINYIISHIPLAPAADIYSAQYNRIGVIQWVAETLKDEFICPSAIPELIEGIVKQHNNCLIAPGSAVGNTAAEAVGATVTQTTLNSIAPHEKILIQCENNTSLVSIGEWIDKLLEEGKDRIINIPENRTQYLELKEPVMILSPNSDGKITWEKLTAVTKHLPLGPLVKIRTRSGREVTATQQKSFLVWNGEKLVQQDGSALKVDDLIPVTKQIPDFQFEYNEIDVQKYLVSNSSMIKMDKQFGQVIGLYLSGGLCTNKYIKISNSTTPVQNLIYNWCNNVNISYHTTITHTNIHSILLSSLFSKMMGSSDDNKILPCEFLMGNKEFIIGLLDGYISSDGIVSKYDGSIMLSSTSKDLILGLSFICNRLGIFGELLEVKSKNDNVLNLYTLSIKNSNLWRKLIGSTCDSKTKYMKDNHYIHNEHNDIVLDPIVSIKYISGIEYVYDVTVPTTTFFSLYNGFNLNDTFHSSGSSKSVGSGIDAMRDLIFARKTLKNESCTIYFTNKLATYEEVLNSRQYIVGNVVSDFIKDFEIESPNNLQKFWWHDAASVLILDSNQQIPNSSNVLRLYLNVIEMYKQRVTIKQLVSSLEREQGSRFVAIYGSIDDGIIDIYPIPYLISDAFKGKNISTLPTEIVETSYLSDIFYAELKNIRVKGISGIKELYPIISPVWRIVLMEHKVTEEDFSNDNVRRVLSPYLGSVWFLYYNEYLMMMTGISPSNLAALCKLAGLIIVANGGKFLAVALPDDRFRTSNNEVVREVNGEKYKLIDSKTIINNNGFYYREVIQENIKETINGWEETLEDNVISPIPQDELLRLNDKFYRRSNNIVTSSNDEFYERIINKSIKINELKPGDYVQFKVTADKRKRNEEIKKVSDDLVRRTKGLSKEERRTIFSTPINIPRTRLMIAAEFIFAETDGSNLRELLALPNIDKTRTICNNMHTVAEILGIEATRTFLIKALNDTISGTSSYIHPANISIISEFITNRGAPHGATFTGISRQPVGPIALATLERAGNVFTTSAMYGKKEDISNVSTSVTMGARMKLGNGAFDIGQNIIENGVEKILINDDTFTAFNRDDRTKNRLPSVALGSSDLFDNVFETMKDIDIGGFDLSKEGEGKEDEINLLNAFGPEDVSDMSAAQNVVEANNKIVRRIEQIADIPQELIDTISLIRTGIPLSPDNIVKFKPIEYKPQKLVSTALVMMKDWTIAPASDKIPDRLQQLLNRYRDEFESHFVPSSSPEFTPSSSSEFVPSMSPESIVQGLPEEDLSGLPNLSDMNLAQQMIKLRREQIGALEPINTEALKQAMQK